MIIPFAVLPLVARGFTLLELLLALSIFAVLAAMGYGGLNAVLETSARAQAYAEETAAVQLAVHRMATELELFLPRAIRNEWGDIQPAMLGTERAMEFTCAAPALRPGRKHGGALRVAYAWQDRALRRTWWPVLDRAPDAQPWRAELLDNVEKFQIRYWDAHLAVHSQWPPEQSENPRLRAVEFALTLPRWGEIRRLVAVHEDAPWQAQAKEAGTSAALAKENTARDYQAAPLPGSNLAPVAPAPNIAAPPSSLPPSNPNQDR